MRRALFVMRYSLWMLLAALLFSIMASLAKVGAHDFSVFELIFYRSLFGCVCIGAWALLTGHKLTTPLWPSHMKRSFLGTMGLATWFFAIMALPLGTAMTMNYTSPLYMALILAAQKFLKGIPLNKPLLLMVVIGFIGVTFVLRPDIHDGQELPALVGMSSGLFAAMAYLQIRELNAMHEPEWRIVFYFTLFGAVAGLTGHLIFEDHLTPINLHDGLVLLALGAAGMAAQLCMTRSWGGGNALITSIFQYSGIVFAALWGQLFFDEPLVPMTMLGIALILFAGVAASWLNKKAARQLAKAQAKALSTPEAQKTKAI